jgi:hypothetical protein
MWRRAWVDGVDQCETPYPETYRLIQNEGTGMVIQGTRAGLPERHDLLRLPADGIPSQGRS